MEEIWKDIPGYEGLYQAGSEGNIRSIKNNRFYGRILHTYDDCTRGYLKLTMYNDKGKNSEKVHRVIAYAFIPNPENKPHINHKNGNRTDNRASNLQWCTNAENAKHGFVVNGRINPWKNKFGFEHNRSKAVAQYTLDMVLIKVHGSVQEASRNVNISKQTIVDSCHNRRVSKYPYVWRFV